MSVKTTQALMPAPIRAPENISTTAWALLAISAILAAFAGGRSHALEGSGGLQMPRIGFDALEFYMINQLARQTKLVKS
eukprot:2242210-Pleurochrysis_carterae.AAC.1